jgi:hypothetical protein
MLGEIDKNFYCSTAGMADCPDMGNCTGCPDYHRKHPTPEQFKKEYGREYSDDGAVYVYTYLGYNQTKGTGFFWVVENYKFQKEHYKDDKVVCACTPFGKPKANWRPE